MCVSLSEPFDFDEWMTLAQSDPDAVEELREYAIEEVIALAPLDMQPRLRALQWRIDMERARASTPLSACIRLSNMMWKLVYDEHGLISAIRDLVHQESGHPLHSADILAFERRKRTP
ncbi:MAG TPA: DUF3135 domain-containing protein [Sulfuricella sp.]|nr:DUF3135 domain-containing protein [Sulfuricella sp.]